MLCCPCFPFFCKIKFLCITNPIAMVSRLSLAANTCVECRGCSLNMGCCSRPRHEFPRSPRLLLFWPAALSSEVMTLACVSPCRSNQRHTGHKTCTIYAQMCSFRHHYQWHIQCECVCMCVCVMCVDVSICVSVCVCVNICMGGIVTQKKKRGEAF